MEPLLKEVSEWRIVAVYYLLSGFVMFRGINFIWNYIFLTKINSAYLAFWVSVPIFISVVIDCIQFFLILWFSTFCAAKYIGKRYLIRNKFKIAENATIFFLIVQLGGLATLFSMYNFNILFMFFVEFVFSVFAFYFLSVRYLKNTETFYSDDSSQTNSVALPQN